MRFKFSSLTVLHILLICFLLATRLFSEPEHIAEAKLVRGKVMVTASKKLINSGHLFSIEDYSVTTNKDGSLNIDFGDSVISLSGNSSFSFVNHYENASTKALDKILDFGWLKVKTRTKGILLKFQDHKERLFSVTTKGTEFILSTGGIYSPVLSGVYVKKGIVEIKGPSLKKTVEVKAEEQFVIEDMKLSSLKPEVFQLFEQQTSKSNNQGVIPSQKSYMKLYDAKQEMRHKQNGYRRGY